MNDLELLRGAAMYGSMNSQDTSTQNGALLVKKGNAIAIASNRFPPGVRARHSRPEKYSFIEHAERGAIYAAAAAGNCIRGATLYCPWFACPDCARAIVLSGISEVVGSARAADATPDRWRALVKDGITILREGGVSMRWLDEKLGVLILFDGKEMEL